MMSIEPCIPSNMCRRAKTFIGIFYEIGICTHDDGASVLDYERRSRRTNWITKRELHVVHEIVVYALLDLFPGTVKWIY